MADQTASDGQSSRHRVLRACEPCKNRKKRCDGTQPCATCVRYQYQCYFSQESRSRLRRARRQASVPVQSTHGSEHASSSRSQPDHRRTDSKDRQRRQSRQAISREAVSYAAFGRLLTDRLQPYRDDDSSSQETRPTATFAFSGGNDMIGMQALTSVLSLDDMQRFSANFVESVHPVYTFIRPVMLRESLTSRFSSGDGSQTFDAVLLGIAALGSLFGDDATPAQDNRHAILAQLAQASLDVETARTIKPSFDLIAALVLRTLYLRSTARPYATWIASCTTMHSIAIIGSEIEELMSTNKSRDWCFDPWQALWIARLLNTWIANEFGRPPVTTPVDASIVPQVPDDPASATPSEQIVYLYHIGDALLSEDQCNPEKLESSIMDLATLRAEQCHDGVLLSRAVMAFCYHRLLRSSETADLKRQTFTTLVEIGLDGLKAARQLAQLKKPWWHLANVPFQFLSSMLVIDTASSFAHIPTALQAFEDVANAMPSFSITEAYSFATKLVELSRRQKTEQLQYLGQYSAIPHDQTSTAHDATSILEDIQMPSPIDGFVMPWQISNIDLDWGFLPNMDIPIFDLDL